MKLSLEDSKKFIQILNDGNEPNERLKKAYLKYLGKLEDYSNFKNGWDGHYAKPIPIEILKLTRDTIDYINTLLTLQPEFNIEPLSDGTICLSLIFKNRELAITIGQNISCYREIDENVLEDDIKIEGMTCLEEKIKWLIS